MKTKIKLILILETTLLIFLIFRCLTLQKSVKHRQNLRGNNPLINAVLYASPLSFFKKLVKENQDWINYPPRNKTKLKYEKISILSLCAEDGLTNHIKILLENGSDFQEAIDWHTKHNNQNAVNIINNCIKNKIYENKNNISF